MPNQISILGKNQYYEAIFQLRDASDEVIDFISKYFDNRKVQVSKIIYLKNGADIYISSKKQAIALARILQKKFGGIVKISEKLFTRSKKTGKNVYRINVLFKPFSFSAGDIIKLGSRLLKITGIGKKIGCIDIKTSKRVVLNISEIQNPEKLKIYDVVVSKIYPHLEIIHPESFQSIPVESTEKIKNIKNIKVVISDNKVYLV